MLQKSDKNKARQKRHLRVRNHIHGTAARPRLNVYRSLKNIYVQVIDDERGVTLASASTKDKGFAKYRSRQGHRRRDRKARDGKGHHGSCLRPWRLHLSWPRRSTCRGCSRGRSQILIKCQKGGK